MVTRKSTKEKGEWSSETISEWSPTQAVTWKAQVSTAPDGGKFVGVRQYITTVKLGEIAGKGGISIKLDDNTGDALQQLASMFRDLRTHVAKPLDVVASKPKRIVGDHFVLVKNTGKFLTAYTIGAGAKVSSFKSRAQLFTKDRATSVLKHLSDAWSMEHHTD